MFNFKLLLFASLLCVSFAQKESKVKVSLYFESLCPYCHEFIVEQLYPGYLIVRDYVTLDLVPYGKIKLNKTDKGMEWTCPHGPSECFLTKAFACILNFNATQMQQLGYINCAVSGSNKKSPEAVIKTLAKQCASDNNFVWEDINSCITSSKVDELLLAYKSQQDSLTNPPFDHVPNIRFNDVYNLNLEDDSRINFVYAICQLLQSPKPSFCDPFSL